MNKLYRCLFCFLLLILFGFPQLANAVDWPPVTPEDLALKDNPADPGAKAMILYRSIERDDQMGSQQEYVRIKIFTDEGKQYADVTIPPFDRSEFKFSGVQGRTIHPDGSIVPFGGQVFEKVVERGQGVHYLARTFTMPDVTPGSIIEYRYTRYWEAFNPSTHMYYYFPRTDWNLQGPLFQKSAHFEFRPARPDLFSWRLQGVHLPEYAKLDSTQDMTRPGAKLVKLDLHDVPAFEQEIYMPPSLEAEMRVLFFYSTDLSIPQGDEYWKSTGKKWISSTESFMNKKGSLSSTVASVTSASDSPDQKLHKLYYYVQGFENTTYEERKSQKEVKALNIREIKSVDDVLSSKYGSRSEINRTFVALARSTGIDATLVKVTERDEALLHREWPAFSQLGYEIASVKLNGSTLYLDPGSPFCPFGTLPWEDTGVIGLLLDKNVPTWVTLPVPDPSGATIKRVANLHLEDDGSITGEVTVTYTGEDAFHRRLRARNEDDAARKKSMENILQAWLPMKGDVELVDVNDWKSSQVPLVVKYKVTLPGYANKAGHRVLIPATFFAGAYKNPFVATKRVNPIIMEYQYDHSDDVTISLPKSMQVESLPKPIKDTNVVADLSVGYAAENGQLHFTRDFQIKLIGLEQKYYGAVRQYFQTVQAGSNEQAVLKIAN